MVKDILLLSLIRLIKENIPFSFLIRPTYKSFVSEYEFCFLFWNQSLSNCDGVTIFPFFL